MFEITQLSNANPDANLHTNSGRNSQRLPSAQQLTGLHRNPIAWLFLAALALLIPERLAGQESTKSASPPGISASEVDQGWLSLFDGSSLFGWKAESDANWSVVDGEIRVSEGATGLLRTTTQFDDFEFRAEFKCPSHTNSGVFLRTSPIPKRPGDDCLELNIAHPDDNPFPTGSLVYQVKATAKVIEGNWNSYRSLVKGNHIKIWINDELVTDFKNPKPLGRGFVGLQFREGKIAFRNIALRPIGQTDLFNGKDLSGWKTDNKLASEFKVTGEGELQIKNGRGQIESESMFGDFLFSTSCKTNAAGLNSGVFFRCIPGDVMNGYESQIQNEMVDGDPTKPKDCGTGGIFRRNNARRIVATDNQWFTKTIVACGPHMSVWVNGFQVSDWTDKRKPHKNPRKGLRLQAGTIIFQGHDPTTDLLFKDIKAREMTKRFPK